MIADIMLNDETKKKIEKLPTMGFRECEAFKAQIVNSIAENPSKFFLYDLIDARMASLSLADAIAVQDGEGVEFNYWSEK